MKFHATIQLGGKTATGIIVPENVVAGLNAGKRPAVTVTINGYVYRSTIAPMGGVHMLPISAEHREGAGVAAEDKVEVEVEVDTVPRIVTVPSDLASLLAKDKEAKLFFETLSYSKQRALVLPIDEAKTPETRERRIAKAMELLHLKQF